MAPRSVILYIAVAKIYGLILFYLLFLRTGMREDDPGFVFIPKGMERAERIEDIKASFWERLAPYDGQWYLDIARKGYRRLEKKETRGGMLPPTNHAFFPLLPSMIRGLRAIFPQSYLAATILLSIVVSAGGALGVWLIARRLEVNPDVTTVLLLVFPAAAFQFVLYTEGFFLCLSAFAILFALRQKAGPAALLGFLGGLCRPQGVLLVLPLAAELVLPTVRRRNRSPRRVLGHIAAALTPLSGFVVMALVSSFGFLEIQGEWGRSYRPLSLIDALLSVIGYRGPPFDLLGLVFGLGLLLLMWRRLPLSLALYGTGAVLLPLLTGSLLSFGRFMSVSIPHFLCLALCLEGRGRLRNVLILALVVLHVLLAKGLIGWYFVG